MKLLILSSAFLLLSILFVDVTIAQDQKDISWEKPDFLEFGVDINELKPLLTELGYLVTERTIIPIELPTAESSQIQLDVEGIVFGGKERIVELIFADGILDMMWMLTEAEEEETIKSHMQNEFGDPSHTIPGAWFYIDQKTALRNDPHEVLFISDRLVEPYKMWLESMTGN